MPSRQFPDGFWWGVATAGHQNEGDNRDSDTWFLEHVTPTVFVEPSGRACDSWNRWPEDLDLAAAMGLNTFRFSVEWARVEPHAGEISAEALDHYEAVVDGCLERGLRPLVTLSHFTAPHWFAMRGGWLDADASARFADHVGRVVGRLGDRIAAVVTFNEPNLSAMLATAGLPAHMADLERATLAAASRAANVPRYRAGNVMLPEEFDAMREGMTRGHLAARDAVRAHRADLPVGLSIAIADEVAEPGGEAHRDAKRAAVYDHWLELARDDDFIGVQNYEQLRYGPAGRLPAKDGEPVNEMGTAIEPASLAGAVRYAHQVSGRPVLVTEHGLGMEDDALRGPFIAASLAGLLAEIHDGVPVLGYCHWTLLDNFEWIFGYQKHFGLHTVDRTTFARAAKPSTAVYAAIARANGLR